MKLLVATGNAGKLAEVREILSPLAQEHGLRLTSLAEERIAAPEEPYGSFAENAAHKARECARASGLWTLADDSGLCVDALGGGPGVQSARYAPTDEERRRKLLKALAGVPTSERGAHFFCAVALGAPDGERLYRAEGQVLGSITTFMRGENGFGYDPLFLPDEAEGRTLAELSPARKNELSHRGRALRNLVPLLTRLARDGDLPAP